MMHERSWKDADTVPVMQQLLGTDNTITPVQVYNNLEVQSLLCLAVGTLLVSMANSILSTGHISDFLVKTQLHFSIRSPAP